jgi:hypothetical protein
MRRLRYSPCQRGGLLRLMRAGELKPDAGANNHSASVLSGAAVARRKARPDPPWQRRAGTLGTTTEEPVTMPISPYITFVAGPFDWPLTIVGGGTVVLAIALNILGLLSWLRRRP